jgi:hypothetical protein
MDSSKSRAVPDNELKNSHQPLKAGLNMAKQNACL